MKLQFATLLKKYSFLFFCSFVAFTSNAQHEKLIDSLKRTDSFEKRRIFYGYMESQGPMLRSTIKHDEYLTVVEQFAKENKERDLLREVEFVRVKKNAVYNFPREKWLDNLQTLIEKYRKDNNLLFLVYCYHEKGQVEFERENYEEAFENYLYCIANIKKVGYENVPNIGKILHEISLQYYFFKDYEQVIHLMQKSIQYPPFSRGLDMQRYNNLGVSYQKLHRMDSATHYFRIGLKIAKKYNSATWEGLIAANIGALYYDNKQYDSSLYYFEKNYKLNSEEKLTSTIQLNALIDMAKINLKLGSLIKTKYFLEKAAGLLSTIKVKNFGDKQQIEISKLNYFEVKTIYLTQIKDYKTALLYKDSIAAKKSKLEKTYHSAVLKNSENQITISNNTAALLQKDNEKKREFYMYFASVLVLLSLGIIGYFYLHQFKIQKRKQNELLLAQKEKATFEKLQAKVELELARKEMQSFVTQIGDQNNRVIKLENELAKAQSLKEDDLIVFEETIEKLRNMRILTDQDWTNFQKKFDRAYPNFRYAIKNIAPTITSSEIRYLMLTQLQFTHKEMALVLGISSSSMRVTWNRVRKRLNAKVDETPNALLEQLLQN